MPRGLDLDPAGRAYVAGVTSSPDFPTTPNASDRTYDDTEGFVTKLSRDGSSLVYSTYLGGTNLDDLLAVDVDSGGQAYVTGQTYSIDFPTTANAFDPTFEPSDAFVTKLNRHRSDLVYSTALGSTGDDEASAIAVHHHGNVFLTGSTTSTDFPTTAAAFDPTFNGGGDAFLTRLDLPPPH